MAKILLVEDDKSLREIYGVRLMAEGYEIVSAGDGEEALAMAIKERPDLIVSDVMMPKISGFDMLDILRSTSETKDVKVIMMTALSSDDQRARGESLGADRYLVKSQVGIEDVVRTVHDVLGDNIAPAPAAPSFPPAGTPVAPTPAPSAPEPVAPSQPAPQAATVEPAPAPQPAPEMPATMPAPLEPNGPILTPPEPTINPLEQPVTIQPTPMAPPMAPPAVPVSLGNPSQPAAQLPQPTAPFSTPAPASLADRVIQPISNQVEPNPQNDIAAQMAQALNDVQAQYPQAQQDTPPPAPALAPVAPLAPPPTPPVPPAPPVA